MRNLLLQEQQCSRVVSVRRVCDGLQSRSTAALQHDRGLCGGLVSRHRGQGRAPVRPESSLREPTRPEAFDGQESVQQRLSTTHHHTQRIIPPSPTTRHSAIHLIHPAAISFYTKKVFI